MWPWGYLILQATVLALSGAVCGLAAWWGRRRSPIARCGRMLTLVTGILVLPPFLLLHGGVQVRVFFPIGCLFYTLGLWMPLQLLLGVRHLRPPVLAWACGAAGAVASGAAGYALFVEPQMLELRPESIPVAGLQEPEIRLALVADIQAVGVGARELRLIEEVNRFDPHFVVLAGDYVHVHLLQAAPIAGVRSVIGAFRPRVATIAVNSDSDGAEQQAQIFAGLPVTWLENAGQAFTVGADRIFFAGLDRHAPRIELATAGCRRGDRLVLVCHAPDPLWALSPEIRDVPYCLAVCGHTHGGQLQVPGFGPVLTLSSVPRAVAAGGRFAMPAGAPLIVSRGIGMEAGFAPRFRFNCRPEVVLIKLIPARP